VLRYVRDDVAMNMESSERTETWKKLIRQEQRRPGIILGGKSAKIRRVWQLDTRLLVVKLSFSKGTSDSLLHSPS